jgi:hypothetical protein
MIEPEILFVSRCLRIKEMKRSKNQFAKWKAANRPRDPDNPTYQDMKQCRKTLRSMQD